MFNGNVALEDIPVEQLQELFKYWDRIRGSRAMPARMDIQPADLASILPMLVLIDVEQEPRRYKIRLMGTDNVKAMGEDLTGKYMEHEVILEKLHWLVENRQPYLVCEKMAWKAKNYLSYYALGLPLSDNSSDVNMILFGCSYFFNTGPGKPVRPAD